MRYGSSVENTRPEAAGNPSRECDQPDIETAVSGGPRPVPLLRGARSSYYLFPRGGQRMTVALVDRGTRLSVNDAIDLVVLEIHDGSVKIGLVGRAKDEG